MIPDKSPTSDKIKKIIDQATRRKDSGLIPLYEERGVYNFYLKVGGGKGKIEAVTETASGKRLRDCDVDNLSIDELKELVRELKGQPGFPRQP